MDKEFLSYPQALSLKELGFDEPCFAIWWVTSDGYEYIYIQYAEITTGIFAPLYQQAFRWFREKHNLVAEIQAPDGKDGVWNPTIHKVYGFGNYYDYNNGFKTYEEAQDACINKLIELIKDGIRN